MFYSIRFPYHFFSHLEAQQADLLNAGHLEPISDDTGWWFYIPQSDVSRVLDYIFLAFRPLDVELFEQYTTTPDLYGEYTRHCPICHIVDHRRYWTLDPADLEHLADTLRESSARIPDRQYYELLDDLHDANASSMPVWYLTNLLYEGLNPPQYKPAIFELLEELSDIYHHPEDYVDDPSQIPVPSRCYFDFKDSYKESVTLYRLVFEGIERSRGKTNLYRDMDEIYRVITSYPNHSEPGYGRPMYQKIDTVVLA